MNTLARLRARPHRLPVRHRRRGPDRLGRDPRARLRRSAARSLATAGGGAARAGHGAALGRPGRADRPTPRRHARAPVAGDRTRRWSPAPRCPAVRSWRRGSPRWRWCSSCPCSRSCWRAGRPRRPCSPSRRWPRWPPSSWPTGGRPTRPASSPSRRRSPASGWSPPGPPRRGRGGRRPGCSSAWRSACRRTSPSGGCCPGLALSALVLVAGTILLDPAVVAAVLGGAWAAGRHPAVAVAPRLVRPRGGRRHLVRHPAAHPRRRRRRARPRLRPPRPRHLPEDRMTIVHDRAGTADPHDRAPQVVPRRPRRARRRARPRGRGDRAARPERRREDHPAADAGHRPGTRHRRAAAARPRPARAGRAAGDPSPARLPARSPPACTAGSPCWRWSSTSPCSRSRPTRPPAAGTRRASWSRSASAGRDAPQGPHALGRHAPARRPRRRPARHPELLVLDEPATGLDPEQRIELRSLLSETAHAGPWCCPRTTPARSRRCASGSW